MASRKCLSFTLKGWLEWLQSGQERKLKSRIKRSWAGYYEVAKLLSSFSKLRKKVRRREVGFYLLNVGASVNVLFNFDTAQERMNELESRLDNLLANIDQVFKVELMKLPPSIRKMRVGDWTGESESLFSVQTHSTSGLARCCDLFPPCWMWRMYCKSMKSFTVYMYVHTRLSSCSFCSLLTEEMSASEVSLAVQVSGFRN